MSENDLVPYFPALLTALAALIAGIAVSLTYQQYRMNALRLKHELFERRFKVYDVFRWFVGSVMREGKTSHAVCESFLREISQAEFLFGPEIPEYLTSVYKKGLDLVRSDREITSVDSLQADERTRVAHENVELLKWFGDQYDVARRLFGKYLNLTRLG
jgi:hypothetical protein